MGKWDIVGDIHGRSGKLRKLLKVLGYKRVSGTYRHPERRVLFLGDYIDRGPDPEGVLIIVQSMVEAGGAVALMGNHELNALHYHRKDSGGRFLRPHREDKTRQHLSTLKQFRNRAKDWERWLCWMEGLPLWLESEDFRAVHACWSDEHIAVIRGKSFADIDFLQVTSNPDTREGRAVEILLKGPEIELPEGVSFLDKDGHSRHSLRIRWWNLSGLSEQSYQSYQSLVMPPGANAPLGEIPRGSLDGHPEYPPDDKPVFCGHYWLHPQKPKKPLAPNVTCLDYSAGKGGPLVSCRWNGSISSSTFHSSIDLGA